MILVYRPELENPPMDKECTIGFSFIGTGATTEHVQIAAGVTRGFPEATWNRIKDYEVVQRLLSLGALSIKDDTDAAATPTSTSPEAVDTLSSQSLTDALELIEASFDLDQLRRWDATDQRIRVKNAIARRVTAITDGKG